MSRNSRSYLLYCGPPKSRLEWIDTSSNFRFIARFAATGRATVDKEGSTYDFILPLPIMSHQRLTTSGHWRRWRARRIGAMGCADIARLTLACRLQQERLKITCGLGLRRTPDRPARGLGRSLWVAQCRCTSAQIEALFVRRAG